jgi:superfamily II DNA or RNA helicase
MKIYHKLLSNHCADQRNSIPGLGNSPGLTLDPHQQEAMDETSLALENGEQEMSIVHACGTGKTILEANILIASLRAKETIHPNGKDLIITTERALVHGIRDELVNLGLDIGIWGLGKAEIDNHPIVLATIQTLQRNQQDLAKKYPVENTQLVIGDEADRYLTEDRKKLLQQFRQSIKIGLTATPSWSDGRDISDLWGRKIHSLPLREGIQKGINVAPLFYAFDAGIDQTSLTIKNHDYDKKTLSAALKEAEIHLAITEVYESVIPSEKRKEFPTLIYLPSVDLVHKVRTTLQEKYSGAGISVKGWTGNTITNKEMQTDVENFNNGALDILILCEMGGRGVNLPRARCVIDAYPTLSANKLEQRHGRGTRKVRPGSDLALSGFQKPFSFAIQIVPRSNHFRPYLLPDLLDCWDDYKAGRLLGTSETRNFHGQCEKIGAPTQIEVQTLRDYIESQDPTHHVRLIRSIDVLEQIQLRENLPQADQEGFFILNEEKYGTLESWSRKHQISSVTIKKYLAGKKGITGKTARGRVLTNAFYSETSVCESLGSLIDEIPQADKSGFFYLEKETKDGVRHERYTTKKGWSTALGVSRTEVGRKLKGIKGLTGKNSGGMLMIGGFFSETTMRTQLGELLTLPQANEEGYFMDEDENGQREKFGMITFWASEYNVSVQPIRARLANMGSKEGRDCKGRRFSFYPEREVRKACSDLKQDYPQVDNNGFFEIQHEGQSKRYGSLRAIAAELGITDRFLKKQIPHIKGITARATTKIICENAYFPVQEVTEACKDILRELPKANDDGFFTIEIEGKPIKYGTLVPWSRVLGVSAPCLKNIVKECTPISGKDRQNRIWENAFYAENDVCAGLRNIPHANEDGTFTQEDNKYALISFWSNYFNITREAIRKRVPLGLAITGKDQTGRTHRNAYFSEKHIREYCQNIITEFPQENEEGFFRKDNKDIKIELPQENEEGFSSLSSEEESLQYATVRTWANKLGISKNDIHRLLKGLEGISGRNQNGKVLKNCYHSYSTLEKYGVIALSKLPKANKNGFFIIFDEEKPEGRRYATKSTWGHELDTSPTTVKSKIGHLTGVTGRDHSGRILKGQFYEEQAVREACKNIRRRK